LSITLPLKVRDAKFDSFRFGGFCGVQSRKPAGIPLI